MRVPFRLRRLARLARQAITPVVPDPRLAVHFFDGTDNFGDVLNGPLVAHYSGRRVRPETNGVDSDLAAIGSILHYFLGAPDPAARPLDVWGAGFIDDGQDAPQTFRRPMRWHAVRGHLTLARIADIEGSAPEGVVLGDPGLLLRTLYPAPATTLHAVGVVPHYVDRDSPVLRALLREHPALHPIDITAGPENVAREIASCDRILSSAMHGLIAADSYGIPNQQIVLSDKLTGGLFKFRDHLSVFDLEPDPWDLRQGLPSRADLDGITRRIDPGDVDAVCARLVDAFPATLRAD